MGGGGGGGRGRGGGGEGGGSSDADTHLWSDRGNTCSTSTTWSYKQQDLEEEDQQMNESVNDKAVCRRAPATPGLLIMYYV